MKMMGIAAAMAVALTGLAPGLTASVAAQRHGGPPHARPHHRGARVVHHRPVCRWVVRHHHRTRVCR